MYNGKNLLYSGTDRSYYPHTNPPSPPWLLLSFGAQCHFIGRLVRENNIIHTYIFFAVASVVARTISRCFISLSCCSAVMVFSGCFGSSESITFVEKENTVNII